MKRYRCFFNWAYLSSSFEADVLIELKKAWEESIPEKMK
jgi:hypothetical protein